MLTSGAVTNWFVIRNAGGLVWSLLGTLFGVLLELFGGGVSVWTWFTSLQKVDVWKFVGTFREFVGAFRGFVGTFWEFVGTITLFILSAGCAGRNLGAF